MPWSKLTFGKHLGKTLPQIIFTDPDWFFWAMDVDLFRGALKKEATILDAKARSIRIPNNEQGTLRAQYFIHIPTWKFGSMEIVPATQPEHRGASPTFRNSVIDLSVAHSIASYDKLGSSNLILSVKHELFGTTKIRMTKKRCEDFFDDDANFVL
jgi:hypothetical protein